MRPAGSGACRLQHAFVRQAVRVFRHRAPKAVGSSDRMHHSCWHGSPRRAKEAPASRAAAQKDAPNSVEARKGRVCLVEAEDILKPRQLCLYGGKGIAGLIVAYIRPRRREALAPSAVPRHSATGSVVFAIAGRAAKAAVMVRNRRRGICGVHSGSSRVWSRSTGPIAASSGISSSDMTVPPYLCAKRSGAFRCREGHDLWCSHATPDPRADHENRGLCVDPVRRARLCPALRGTHVTDVYRGDLGLSLRSL